MPDRKYLEGHTINHTDLHNGDKVWVEFTNPTWGPWAVEGYVVLDKVSERAYVGGQGLDAAARIELIVAAPTPREKDIARLSARLASVPGAPDTDKARRRLVGVILDNLDDEEGEDRR